MFEVAEVGRTVAKEGYVAEMAKLRYRFVVPWMRQRVFEQFRAHDQADVTRP
jgi:hypothetical protein